MTPFSDCSPEVQRAWVTSLNGEHFYIREADSVFVLRRYSLPQGVSWTMSWKNQPLNEVIIDRPLDEQLRWAYDRFLSLLQADLDAFARRRPGAALATSVWERL